MGMLQGSLAQTSMLEGEHAGLTGIGDNSAALLDAAARPEGPPRRFSAVDTAPYLHSCWSVVRVVTSEGEATCSSGF